MVLVAVLFCRQIVVKICSSLGGTKEVGLISAILLPTSLISLLIFDGGISQELTHMTIDLYLCVCMCVYCKSYLFLLQIHYLQIIVNFTESNSTISLFPEGN